MSYSKFEQAYLKVIKECGDNPDGEEQQVNECGDEVTTEAKKSENSRKVVTFYTENQDLIDALNSGFEEAVFFVSTEDENGEETVKEVKVKNDGFEEISVVDAPAEAEDEAEDDEEFNEVTEGAMGAGVGGAAGAAIGSLAGPVGTVVGAGVGGAIGGAL